MSAAETIAKAIEKLEAQRAASTQPGLAWRTEPTTELEKGCRCLSCWETVPGFLDITSDGDGPRGRDDLYPSLATGDAELIVTLHRTIDAQLAILRAGLPDAAEAFSEAGQAYHAAATILATAILAGDR